MTKSRATFMVALVAVATATVTTTARAAVTEHPITDPRLIGTSREVTAPRIQTRSATGGEGATSAHVEVLTSDTVAVAAKLRALGATVTGDVPGAVVQARVPLAALQTVANLPGVTDVRALRRSGIPPATPEFAVGTGPTYGNEVLRTQADAWHRAGFVGAGAKVAIVDYFDFSLWNPAEHGAVPDAAHQVCFDSYGAGLCAGVHQIALFPGAGAHGVAVAEIVRDMAPGAELFLASVGTVSDLRAAITWFASRGVTVMTRSLGAAYDGPGDGTGPLDAVVDYAVARGITWFNSGGNDALDAYVARDIRSTDAEGYVNFARPGDLPDTWLRIDALASDGYCYFLDGVRWGNDWNLPAAQRTDYRIEVWEAGDNFASGVGLYSSNPVPGLVVPVDLNDPLSTGYQGAVGAGHNVIDASQRRGARPLEGADLMICAQGSIRSPQNTAVTYLRIRRNVATPVGSRPDHLEVAISGAAFTEPGLGDRRGTAAKPVVDSKNPGLVAVGAADPLSPLFPAQPDSVADYSSQGPTNDGRIKPDMAAPSGMGSTIYSGGFSGTSSASPTAAGAAALLAGAGLGGRGAGLAALTKHFTVDLGAKGPDNAYGTGLLRLPAPPTTATPGTRGAYHPLLSPNHFVDTRTGSSHVGAKFGPFPAGTILDYAVVGGQVPSFGVGAVALTVTVSDTTADGAVQVVPYLRSTIGTTATLQAPKGATRSTFTIVEVGQGSKISIYLPSGGNVSIDRLGWFGKGDAATTAGRFVPLAAPERWLDTRTASKLPAAFHGSPRRLAPGETIDLPVPAASALAALAPGTVQALVVNLTAVQGDGNGWLRAARTGVRMTYLHHTTIAVAPTLATMSASIVPVDVARRFSIVGNRHVHVAVDVVGYITAAGAPSSIDGLYVPVRPYRAYDTRFVAAGAFSARERRTFATGGAARGVPVSVRALDVTVSVPSPATSGSASVYTAARPPRYANMNYVAGRAASTTVLARAGTNGTSPTLTGFTSTAGHVIIDVSGYFVAAPI